LAEDDENDESSMAELAILVRYREKRYRREKLDEGKGEEEGSNRRSLNKEAIVGHSSEFDAVWPFIRC
jgi:hypothetical protein